MRNFVEFVEQFIALLWGYWFSPQLFFDLIKLLKAMARIERTVHIVLLILLFLLKPNNSSCLSLYFKSNIKIISILYYYFNIKMSVN